MISYETSFSAYNLKLDQMLDLLKQLPMDERNILYLHYYEGYTIKEIGIMLNKNPNTISSKLQRARKKLKMEVEKNE